MNENVEAWGLGAIGLAKGVAHELAPNTATKAWGYIGAFVLAYEATCGQNQLLSEGCDRALLKHPIATRAAIGVTALHLMNAFEAVGLEQLDPIHQLSEFIKRKVD